METVKSIGNYEPDLLHELVKLLPENPKARQEVFGQKDLDALIQQMAFALFIIQGTTDERERCAVLGHGFRFNPTQAAAFLAEVRNSKDLNLC